MQRWLRAALAAALWLGAHAALAETLVYGGARDFAPFESVDAEGRAQGFQVELARALGREMGATIEVRLGDWPAVEAAFRKGELPLVAMSRTRAREAWALFARSHATPAMGVYHRAGTRAPQSLQELARQALVVLDSEPMRESVREFLADPGFRVSAAPSAQAALESVRDGAAAFALLPRAYADPLLRDARVRGVADSGFSPRLQAYAYAVAPGNEALKARVEAALDALDRSGELDALRRQWLSSEREARERDRLLDRLARDRWTLAGVVAAALAALGLLGAGLRRRTLKHRAERERRRAAEASLRAAEDRWARVFTRARDGMLITERGSARIVEANDAICALAGARRDALLGQPLDALAAVVSQAALALVRSLLARHGAADAVPVELHSPAGETRHCFVTSEAYEEDGRGFVLTVVRDVSDHVRENEELRRGYDAMLAEARERAARADAELQAFTAAVSHDLRAPMGAIAGAAGMLAEDLRAGDAAGVERHAERIERSTRRMDQMLTALARLARAGRDAVRRTTVDMAAVAAEAWETIAATDGARRVSYQCAPLPPAQADRDLALLAWQNLLGNAFKFTARAAEAKVGVDAFEEAGRQWYRIADNGAGFDMAQAGRIFEPFRRLHDERDFPGTGIGLSIVQRIVGRHDGEIRVRSAVGVGTVFEFTLSPAPSRA